MLPALISHIIHRGADNVANYKLSGKILRLRIQRYSINGIFLVMQTNYLSK